MILDKESFFRLFREGARRRRKPACRQAGARQVSGSYTTEMHRAGTDLPAGMQGFTEVFTTTPFVSVKNAEVLRRWRNWDEQHSLLPYLYSIKNYSYI